VGETFTYRDEKKDPRRTCGSFSYDRETVHPDVRQYWRNPDNTDM